MDDDMFDWPRYLAQTNSKAVPTSIFKHVCQLFCPTLCCYKYDIVGTEASNQIYQKRNILYYYIPFSE